MNNNFNNIKEIFKHVSIENFITYFEVFKENMNIYSNKEILAAFENNSESWTKSASATRASKGKAIFKNHLEIEALEYIIYEANSKKLTKGIKRKAEKLYKKYNVKSKLLTSDASKFNEKDKTIELENLKIRVDVESIDNNKTLTAEQKFALIKIRFGQSSYRKKLMEYWGGCAVSGCTNLDILLASHIKPYKECANNEQFDIFNGLLLSPNYDKLFDKHLITFENSGKIIISDSISEGDLKKLGISRNDCILEGKLTRSHIHFLNQHREHFINIH